LFIGDSITAQVEDFFSQVVPVFNGTNCGASLSFPLALAGAWLAPPTVTLTGYSSLATCRRATFIGGTTSADSALNNRIIADNFGFRIFGTNTASTSSQEKLFGSNWLNEALAVGPVRVSVPILKEATGVTTDDLRLRILNTAGTLVASGSYFNTYAATDTLVWVSADIPQGTVFAANGGSWTISYRPSTATVAGKTLTVIGRQEVRRVTPIAGGMVVANFGAGGTTAAQWAAYDNISYNFMSSMQPDFCFIALGQNGTSSAGQHQTDVTAVANKMLTARSAIKMILWSTHATSAGNGAGLAQQAHVTGNENAAIANGWLHLNVQEAMPKYEYLNQSLSNNWSSIATGKRIPAFSLVRHPSASSTIYVARASHEKTATTPDVDTTNWAGPLTIAGTEVVDSPLFGKTNQIISDGTHLSHMGNHMMLQALSGLISEASASVTSVDPVGIALILPYRPGETGVTCEIYNESNILVDDGIALTETSEPGKYSASVSLDTGYYTVLIYSNGATIRGADFAIHVVGLGVPDYADTIDELQNRKQVKNTLGTITGLVA
jgi:hypothetical protein